MAELKGRVPKLVLELAAGAPEDTRARVAGVDLSSASFGVPLPLDPGEYAVVVSAPGHSDRLLSVKLSGGLSRLSIAPGAPLVPDEPIEQPPPAAEAESESSSWLPTSRRTWTYIIGGAGLAGVSIGVVTGMLTLRQKDIANANCDDRRRVCSPEGMDANEAGRTLGAISATSVVVGIAGVGAATYLYFTEPETSEHSAIRAAISPSSAALTFQRHF
jgi:hypothetical protein